MTTYGSSYRGYPLDLHDDGSVTAFEPPGATLADRIGGASTEADARKIIDAYDRVKAAMPALPPGVTPAYQRDRRRALWDRIRRATCEDCPQVDAIGDILRGEPGDLALRTCYQCGQDYLVLVDGQEADSANRTTT